MCPSNVFAMADTDRTTAINQPGKLLRPVRAARDVYHSSKLKLQQSQEVPHRKFSANRETKGLGKNSYTREFCK